MHTHINQNENAKSSVLQTNRFCSSKCVCTSGGSSGLIIYEALALQVLRWLKMSKRDFLFLMGIKVEPVNVFFCLRNPTQLFLTLRHVRAERNWQRTDIEFYSNAKPSAKCVRSFLLLSFKSIRCGKKNNPSLRCLQCGQKWCAMRRHCQKPFASPFNSFYRYLLYRWKQSQPSTKCCFIENIFFLLMSIFLQWMYSDRSEIKRDTKMAWNHWINAELSFAFPSWWQCCSHWRCYESVYPYQVWHKNNRIDSSSSGHSTRSTYTVRAQLLTLGHE